MRGEIMVQMMKLKSIAGRGKMNEVKEFVNEVLESGNKLVLFCHLHEIVDECLALWPDAVTVTGRDSSAQRERNIHAFQNDPKCQLIVCNHKAAGVGITLTASSRVAFIEYPWTYADCVQCEDRTHRIGQVNNVMCTYFLGQETIDERMWDIISNKMAIGNTITGATDDMDGMEMIDKTLQMFNI
jgi:SWI/SNF-related matrix-associated actin-dependent regulator 1 of chromatin subfamily A